MAPTSTPMTDDEIVEFYKERYRHPFLLRGYIQADLHELESARDTAWYRAGWYEILGYDRHGRSYITVDDSWGGNNTTPQIQILSDWNDRRKSW